MIRASDPVQFYLWSRPSLLGDLDQDLSFPVGATVWLGFCRDRDLWQARFWGLEGNATQAEKHQRQGLLFRLFLLRTSDLHLMIEVNCCDLPLGRMI